MAVILVSGATSVVGRYLLPLFSPQQHRIYALSHQQGPAPGRYPQSEWVTWVSHDIKNTLPPNIVAMVDTLIHLAPLPLLSGSEWPCLKRVVAIGTTSIYTKTNSGSEYERCMVAEQRAAEADLVRIGAEHGLRWTLFRPTLVYDGLHDKNIARIARFIRHARVFPLPWVASGRRQPLHAVDLASACVAVLDNTRSLSRCYTLAGAEVLRYSDMVQRVFQCCGLRPHIIRVPLWLYRFGFTLLKWHPRYANLTLQMIERMSQDMVFDISAAQADFGFAPRIFQFDSNRAQSKNGDSN